jgi:hypothetical protein
MKWLKSRWRSLLGTLCVLVAVLVVGNRLLPGSLAGANTTDWPSKIVGPSCRSVALERHIPTDLAEHTCEAIRE